MNELDAAATELWRWFGQYAGEVECEAKQQFHELPPALAQLDELVGRLGPGVRWEIGLYVHGGFSPCPRPSLL